MNDGMNDGMSDAKKRAARTPDHDGLEAALRAATPAPLDDGGFSARVLQALPFAGIDARVTPQAALETLQARRRGERALARYSLAGAAAGVALAAQLGMPASAAATPETLVAVTVAILIALGALGWSFARDASA